MEEQERLCDDIVEAVNAHINFPRLSGLRSLPKYPPEGGGETRRSVTGAKYIVEILLPYSLSTKNKKCSLTKDAMLKSIHRHEARLKYKGNLKHDVWRSLREK